MNEVATRHRMELFVPTGNGETVNDIRFVVHRERWMEEQRAILPLGTRLTWYRGAGLGTNQYFLDQTGWALKRITYGTTEA